MYEILTLNKIANCGIDRLDNNLFNVSDDCTKPDGVILRSFNMHDMELPDSLLAVARAGAGVNNIPIDACSEKGIVVFNTPGANANAVAELVMAGILLSSRKVVQGIEWAKTLIGEGDMVGKLVEKGKGAFVGPEIKGKKLGVIGLGAIGALVANQAVAMGMDVEGYDPYISVDAAWKLSRHIKKSADLKMMISRCDYITIHMPLTDSTRHIINDEMFDCMNEGTRLLNFARGELVDTDALKRAIDNGKIAAYITDFPSEATLKMDNCINIPHLGASTPESEDNCAVMAADELKDFLLHGNIKNSVNFPNCELPVESKYRVTIAHKNIPNLLAKFSGVFADENINIINMINKSKKDYAYTLVDVDEVPSDLMDRLNEIEGVCKIRIIEEY